MITVLIIVGLFTYRFLTYPENYKLVKLFKTIYKVGDVPDANTYQMNCKLETERNLIFSLGQVDKAIVYNGFFSFDKTLAKEKTERVLEILNDTSSYIWGEVGTFIQGKKIVYYDKENFPIGLTDIDAEGGQTYSVPYLKKMKWCALKNVAYNEIDKLIIE